MTNKRDYIEALRGVIEHTHGCAAFWLRTEHVHETLEGQTVWNGDVEVFGLVGHAKALHAFGWALPDGTNGQKAKHVTVLEMPPVTNAKTAVHSSVMADKPREHE